MHAKEETGKTTLGEHKHAAEHGAIPLAGNVQIDKFTLGVVHTD
jgi:hypothetical protein